MPSFAQDGGTGLSLEDLIPDAAVENPEQWAQQGTSETESAAAIDPDSPTMALDGSALAWPEDLDLPPLEELEPGEEVQYADLELTGPQLAFSEAETERISDDLILGFPQKEPPFSATGDFVDRFADLSTIKQLDSDSDNLAQLGARAKQDETLLANLLRVYGYYDGRVVRSISAIDAGEDDAGDRARVRFDVIPGERYTYGAIDLGNLTSASDGPALRGDFGIKPGDYLQSDEIVAERADLDTALGESGYPFAVIDDPQLLIDHERREGDLTMPVAPNGKYRFGSVVSSDPEFLSSRHLAQIARFESGDIYRRSLEFDLRRAILATGLVSSVTVTPNEVSPPADGAPGTVDMAVALERAKLRTIAGAIGYGTEEGFRVQASWEHRNLFPPEGLLRVRGIAGTQEQLGGVTVRFNNFGGRDKVLTFDAYASTQDNAAFEARTVAFRASFERLSNLLFQKPFSWALGTEVLYTDERNRVISGIPRDRQEYFIAGIFGRATIDTSDDLLDPTRGFRLTAFVAPEASRTVGENFFYVRNQFDASYYRSVSDSVVMAGRLRLATIPGAPIFAIAPSRRLYAGGGASVRGYGYQAIGPKNDLGEPTGGRSLVEASLEARIRTGFFDGALSVVPFFDLGSVSIETTPNFRTNKFGAGVGVRYATGFGPLRLDVGFPINPDPDDSVVAVYVSLGQAF
ncbi:autotransporter assembly complex family protein [Qipengyuania sp.]|uniref:autotransporter assembly complex protein TamA n=1 Tax=Qipengyuania sp. TaxID=2004515 RepID=UPI0035C85A97